jgi:hypothetical protein
MNSTEAFLALFEGKRIRRVQWADKSIYLFINNEQLNCSESNYFSDTVFNFHTNLVIANNDIEWEEFFLEWDWEFNDKFKFYNKPEEYSIVYIDQVFLVASKKSNKEPWTLLKKIYTDSKNFSLYKDMEKIP